MRLRPRMDRLLLGFRGLGLLRGWPFQDPDEAVSEVEAMARILSGSDDLEERELDSLEVGEAYAAWAATYETSGNPLIAAEEPAVSGFLEPLQPGRALDLASGTGRLSAILADLGHQVWAIDGSPAMLQRARTLGTPGALSCGDFDRLPFRNASFDLVTCGLALTHVKDLGPPIAEIARVLRPGGHAVLSDIHPLAAATGAHAFFQRADGSHAVTRNEVHWPSAHVVALRAADLTVENLAEPLFDRPSLESVSTPELRSAMESAVLGLPYVLVWHLRRPVE